MESKKPVLFQAQNFLENENFDVTFSGSINSCFDLLAKRRSFVMLLKFLSNIDSLSRELARNLMALSYILSACPLIIGERTRNFSLDEGVLHTRHGISAVNLKTFMNLMALDLHPVVQSARGGYYVKIDGERLKTIRIDRDMSVGELSELIGVSRTMVYSYENSGLGMTVSTLIKLEEALEEPIAMPLDVFKIPSSQEGGGLDDPLKGKNAFERLNKIGFKIVPITRAPFDAVAKSDQEPMLTKLDGKPKETLKNVKILKDISDVIDCFAFILTSSNDSEDNLEGVPIIKKSELEGMESSDEFFEIFNERL